MSSSERGVPLNVILAATQARAEKESLRAVAAAIGISPNALRNLFAGAAPRPATIRKLAAWYFRYARSGAGDLDSRFASAAVAYLSKGLPEDRRRALEAELLSVIARHYASVGAAPLAEEE